MDTFKNKNIIELPKQVADKIAAGEVVDRPLSIVKELIENSIDAGATSIIIDIKNGGKSYIRVTDNGSGIEKSDVDLAFKRHATSKIKSAEDLDHIQSLGFRGEALASIAAVSRVELITKTISEKAGIRVKIEGGVVLEKEETGCPGGTTIIIEDLFFNTPARLKFMKPDATESSLIIDFVSKMTLAYPQIKIRLISNGNILFSTTGKRDIYSNILTIYSKEIGDKLIPLQEAYEHMSLIAYVSPPNNSKTNRKSQIFFVNGRYINSKVMENAVTDAYLEKLFDGRYPIAFLFLQVDPEKLDVNIHPNKKEVRFDDDRPIKDFISAAIKKGLLTKEALPEIKEKNLFKLAPSVPVTNEAPEGQIDIKNILSTKRVLEREMQNYTPGNLQQIGETLEIYKPNIKFDPSELSVTGSIFGTYITAVDENNLYLIDQHAAHERVFYEQLLEQYQNEEKMQQLILTPFIVNVTHAVKNDTGKLLDFLGNFGFQIEEFGPTAYIIKAIPIFMELGEATEFLEYLLDNISGEKDLENRKIIDSIITNACKKSVKAHDVLAKQEIKQLLSDLAKTKNPHSCPHGRPTFIRLNKSEIEKMFKRV